METEFNVDPNLLLYSIINHKYIKIKTVKRNQKFNIYLFLYVEGLSAFENKRKVLHAKKINLNQF